MERLEKCEMDITYFGVEMTGIACLLHALIDTHPNREALLQAFKFQIQRWNAERERAEKQFHVDDGLREDEADCLDTWAEYIKPRAS